MTRHAFGIVTSPAWLGAAEKTSAAFGSKVSYFDSNICSHSHQTSRCWWLDRESLLLHPESVSTQDQKRFAAHSSIQNTLTWTHSFHHYTARPNTNHNQTIVMYAPSLSSPESSSLQPNSAVTPWAKAWTRLPAPATELLPFLGRHLISAIPLLFHCFSTISWFQSIL